MWHGMHGLGWGMMGFGWVFGALFLALVMALIVLLIIRLARGPRYCGHKHMHHMHHGHHGYGHHGYYEKREEGEVRSGGASDEEDVLEILKRRYAKGEITKSEYEEVKKDLS